MWGNLHTWFSVAIQQRVGRFCFVTWPSAADPALQISNLILIILSIKNIFHTVNIWFPMAIHGYVGVFVHQNNHILVSIMVIPPLSGVTPKYNLEVASVSLYSIYIHIFIYIHVYSYLHTCIYIYIYVCTHIYIYIHVHMYLICLSYCSVLCPQITVISIGCTITSFLSSRVTSPDVW